jgi:hypothetical protein
VGWAFRSASSTVQQRTSSLGLDLDALQAQGRLFTPWGRDLIMRSAFLGIRGVLSGEKVARRIAVARSRDAEFWAKHDPTIPARFRSLKPVDSAHAGPVSKWRAAVARKRAM